MSPEDEFPPVENHSSKVTASYLSLGKGSEACFGSCRISLSKEGRFTAQPPDVTEVEITSTNKFVFIVEHFINACRLGERQFFKSPYKQKRGRTFKKSSHNLEITVTWHFSPHPANALYILCLRKTWYTYRDRKDILSMMFCHLFFHFML